MLALIIVGVVCLLTGGGIVAIYYQNIMSKVGEVKTIVTDTKKVL